MATKTKKRTAPKAKAPQRWRFVKDDDGHTYLIPADKRKAFDLWVEASPYWDGYEGEDFQGDETGTSSSNYTFTDPKED